jgi:hypothetical protein
VRPETGREAGLGHGSSVSWKQPANLSPWHDVFHQQGLLLKGAAIGAVDASCKQRSWNF